ncbi:MAG: BadF/BadG/BcrA/BcrD ATPase family protein [Armatimonadota bacterium]
MILVGVDAGGTHTRALAVREDGGPVGQSLRGPANPYKVGVARAAREILSAIRQAARRNPVTLAVAGVAGSEYEDLRHPLEARVGSKLPGVVRIVHDSLIVLEGAFPGHPGIVVIAGTGSVVFGRNAQGDEARAGGWGHLVDDQGSGFAIGRDVLAAVLRAYDGRGSSTVLTPLVLDALNLKHEDEVAAAVRRLGPYDVAGLARCAFSAAGAGDRIAGEILSRAAEEMSVTTSAVAKRLGFEDRAPVAMTGGLFEDRLLRSLFSEILALRYPAAVLVEPRLRPVAGALCKAFELVGRRPDETLVERLARGAGVNKGIDQPIA